MSYTELTWANAAEEVTSVADQLDSLGAQSAKDRWALDALADHLSSGGQRLVGMDLVAAFPPDALVPDVPRRRHGVAEGLTVARDLLVFAPIAITWFVLRKAISAWNASGSNESLIKFWQSHPASVVPVSTSAGYVILALVVMGALTIVIAILDRRGAAKVAEQRRRLANVLAVSTIWLAAPAPSSTVSSTDLARVADRIFTSTKTLDQTMTRVAAALNSTPMDGLADALQEWKKSAAEWSASAQTLTALSKDMKSSTDMITEFVKLRQAIEQKEAELRGALETLIGQVEETAQRAAEEALAHGQVADTVRDATRQLAVALNQFTDRTEFLESLIHQVRQLLIVLGDGYGPAGFRDNG